jgi:hypothetical protein
VHDGGAAVYFKLVGSSQKEEIFASFHHRLFRTLFRPAPPIARLVEQRMKLSGLRPREFAAAYYRAFYAIEDKKDSIGSNKLSKRAIEAARCVLG